MAARADNRGMDYPAHLARQRLTRDGRAVLVRPVRPADEGALAAFFAALSDGTRRLRFQRFTSTRIDYDRHMAFVCEADGRIVGDARYVANPSTRSCELGIVIADAWHHSGVAQLLMHALTRAAQARGVETMEGLVLAENGDMLDFVRELGFEAHPSREDATLVRIVKVL